MSDTRTARNSEIVSAYLAGATVASIAQSLGIGQGTAWRAVDAAGVGRRQGPHLHALTIQPLTHPASLAYAAGIFDGEGNIYWRRRSGRANSVRIAIYSTTPALMDWLCASFSGGHVTWDHARTVRHGWKPAAKWELNRVRDARAFLASVLPYLVIRKSDAEDALALLNRYT